MNIRIADNNDKNRIRDIWDICFKESDAYTNYYFTRRFHPEHTIVLEIDGEIVSALQLNPYTMMLRGMSFDIAYIVGVSTLPEYRGKGYMRAIMDYAFNYIYGQGQGFLILKPIARELYLPYEMDYCFDFDETAMYVDLAQVNGGVAINKEQELLNIYVNAMIGKNAYALRDINYYRELLIEMRADNSIIEQNDKSYVIYNLKSKKIRECFLNEKLINKGQNIMIRIINLKMVLASIKYQNDFSITIKTIDKHMEINNYSFLLSVQGGVATVVKTDRNCDIEINISDMAQLIFGHKPSGNAILDKAFPISKNYFADEV